MTELVVGLIGWFRKQIQSSDGLMTIIPTISFLVGILSIYTNQSMFGLVIAFLLAVFSFLSFATVGDWVGSILLAALACAGEILAILLMVYTRQIISIVAMGAILIFSNGRFVAWRAKQTALNHLNSPFRT